jgi:hypothetical protein
MSTHHRVVAQRDAADEAASTICTSLMDAQDIESAHRDRQQRAQKLIQALASLFEEPELEFMQEALIRDLCFAADRNAGWASGRLHEVLGEIKEALETFNGSEIADTRLQRKNDYAARLEFQQEAWQDLLAAAQGAHRQLVGRDWLPAPKGRTADKRLTASAADARSRLARHGIA